MNNYTVSNIGFPLDKWIDTKTGLFHSTGRAYTLETNELAAKLNVGVEYIFDLCYPVGFNAYNNNQNLPYMNVSGVDIKFSDEPKKSVKRVHPGVGDHRIQRIREGSDCSPEERFDEMSRDKAVKMEFLVLGEFYPSRSKKPGRFGTIKLYNKNISDFCGNNSLDYTTVFWSTLAHEAFHAFHYSMFKNAGRQDRWDKAGAKNDRDIVKESLAATIEYIFLINQEGEGISIINGSAMRDYLEDSWRSFDVEDYPYSGALGSGGLGLTKIAIPPVGVGRLIDKSFYDWKTAANAIKTTYWLADPWISRLFTNP